MTNQEAIAEEKEIERRKARVQAYASLKHRLVSIDDRIQLIQSYIRGHTEWSATGMQIIVCGGSGCDPFVSHEFSVAQYAEAVLPMFQSRRGKIEAELAAL